jgi:hypothetical protein
MTLEVTMALKFLGKDPNSLNNGSPTVYLDEERDTYVLQGWKVDDERAKELDVPAMRR